jgi:hypothetical protein
MSKKHKVCFIHIEKNAGMSIRDTLSTELGVPHFKSPWYFGPMRGKGGQRAIDYINLLGEKEYANYFSFAFVRNPFDRLTSWYRYDNYGKNTFEDWLAHFFEHIKLDQMAYLIGKDGNVSVDFVGRFEELDTDFLKVCNELGIRDINLPKTNQTEKKDYRTYYTDKTRALVEEKLAREITLFDYKF